MRSPPSPKNFPKYDDGKGVSSQHGLVAECQETAHQLNQTHGNGSVARETFAPCEPGGKNQTGESRHDMSTRHSLRLNDTAEKKCIRVKPHLLYVRFICRSYRDPVGPFYDFAEEQSAFDKTPLRLRRLSETGDHTRAMLLSRYELRPIRLRRRNQNGGSFYELFNNAVTDYRIFIDLDSEVATWLACWNCHR